jgi:hypothetical protein
MSKVKKEPDKGDFVKSRKRPDRAKKIQERKNTSETVVKKCLRKAICDNDNKDVVVEFIRQRVELCSKRVRSASLILNLLVQEVFDGLHSHKNVTNVWNDTYVRNILLGTSNCPIVKNILKRFPKLYLDKSLRHTGDGNIYTHAAKKLIVNIKNVLVVSTPKLIKKVVYDSIKDKDQSVLALFAVNGWDMKQVRETEVLTTATSDFIALCRSKLGLEGTERIDKKWLKKEDNLARMLDFRVFAIQTLKTLEKKEYTILPIARTKAHFITLDNMGFWGLCKDCKFLDCGLYDENKQTNTIVKEYWTSVFNLNTASSKTFSGTICTDGIVVDIHYQRPKNYKENGKEEKRFESKGYRVLGNDPGRTNIFYFAEELVDGTKRKYKMTRSQYYNESGSRSAIKLSNTWNRNIQEELNIMSANSLKGVGLNQFEERLAVVLPLEDALWKEYLRPRWSRQRFRNHAGKKKVFANFFNRIERDTEGDEKIVIAYGSAKFAHGGKGEISVPTSKAYKECTFRFKTIPIDEFRTSRVCYDDLSLLQGVAKWSNYQKVALRGLLWCVSTTKYGGKLINRDLNAALNIRRCLVDGRPTELNRSKQQQKLLPLKIVKIIRDSGKRKLNKV